MEISLGELSEVSQYYAICNSCAEHMISRGIFQWSENYPSEKIIENDVRRGELWKITAHKRIVGIIVLTETVDTEYKTVKWLSENRNNLYVHRLAVSPDCQGQGFARKLMDFAEKYANDKNYTSIRLDTFSQNKRNQFFYEKRNYTKLESIFFPNQSDFPFFCYEKIIDV